MTKTQIENMVIEEQLNLNKEFFS